MGRWRAGDAKVLSTAKAMPAVRARAAMAAMSSTALSGFTGVSKYSSFVRGVIAASRLAGLVRSTGMTLMPKRGSPVSVSATVLE